VPTQPLIRRDTRWKPKRQM